MTQVLSTENHVLSAAQFSTEDLAGIFAEADQMRKLMANEESCRKLAGRHVGKHVTALFYEPSTRTRLISERAALALGATVTSTENAGEFSSAVKGETIEDTVLTLAQFAQVAVIRHKEKGALDRAAAVAGNKISLINAGDGAGEHPTQAKLDLYTINYEMGRTDSLHTAIIGDLAKGRTARSLAILMSKFKNNHLTLVSHRNRRMGDDIKQCLDDSGTTYTETDTLEGEAEVADVFYMTREQLERRTAVAKFVQKQLVRHGFVRPLVIDEGMVQRMKHDAIVIHPFPRNGEITREVDAMPQAKYFDQMGNGLFIRMVLIDRLLRGESVSSGHAPMAHTAAA